MANHVAKQPYRAPVIEDWGTVTDLTGIGFTHPGADCKGGSVTHSMGCSPPGGGGGANNNRP